MKKEIVYITDPRVLNIPIHECGESLIDLKNQEIIQYGPIPETELTKDCYTKLRETVFDKLCRAQENLPNGWRFRVYEGFRSREVQKILFDQEYKIVVEKNPSNADPAELFHETTRLVSPVTNFDGSINIPAHNTGGAVDIEIMMESGELVNMGMEAKDWIDVDPDLCLSDCPILDDEAQANRRILFEVMTEQDFVNYPTEWWHFSYGDRYWAYHKQQKHAIYGSADNF